MDSVLNIDEALVNNYVQTLVMNTLQAYQGGTNISWQDAELAVHLVYLFGELQKGTKGEHLLIQFSTRLMHLICRSSRVCSSSSSSQIYTCR